MIHKNAMNLFERPAATALLLLPLMLAAWSLRPQCVTNTPSVQLVNSSDRDLLECVAAGDIKYSVDILKMRVNTYDVTQMAGFTDVVLEVAVRQRPAFSYRNEFLVTSKAFIREERFDDLYAEAFRRQWKEAAPVLKYVRAHAGASAGIPNTNLELLKHYYLKLDDPTLYPVLHPHDPTMNCFNEPTAISLQQDIFQILSRSGAPGAAILADLDISETHRRAPAARTAP